MDDGGPIERRTGWDRRAAGERRSNPDRRRQRDRRGNPRAETAVGDGPRSDEPRPYGFRSFADRRDLAERRAAAAADGDRRRSDDRRAGALSHGDTDVELTPEEVLALLHHPGDKDE